MDDHWFCLLLVVEEKWEQVEEGPLEEDIWEQLTKHNTNILLLKLKRCKPHKQYCYKNQPIRTNDMKEKLTGNPQLPLVDLILLRFHEEHLAGKRELLALKLLNK